MPVALRAATREIYSPTVRIERLIEMIMPLFSSQNTQGPRDPRPHVVYEIMSHISAAN